MTIQPERHGLRTSRGAAVLVAVVLLAGCGTSASPSPSPTAPTSSAAVTPTTAAAPTPSPAATSVVPPASEPTASSSPSVSPAASPAQTVTPPATAGKASLASSKARAKTTSEDARAGAKAVNTVAVDLYRRMISSGKNLVFSPASVMIALSMARPGARGQTAAQMDEVMRDAATNANAAWMNALDRALDKRTSTYKDEEGATRKVTLRLANGAFLQRDYPFEQPYLDALAQRFGAGIRLTDFRADPAASRKTINAWVKDRTQGRIPRLLAAGDIKPSTRFALVNAIYLKAAWARAFSPGDTVSAPFRLASGTSVRVPTMVGPKEMGWVRYATGSGWRAAELPYIGGKLAMTVILPDTLKAFEKSMTRKGLDAIVGKVANAPLEWPNPKFPSDAGIAWKIALPKFSFESRADLKSALAAAGMPDAFEASLADFTGIADPAKTGEAPLYISKAIHQANISVDEQGTTAAASTAILGETGGGPETKYFKVNRPFIFVLRDVPTGAILFMGRVVDPRAH